MKFVFDDDNKRLIFSNETKGREEKKILSIRQLVQSRKIWVNNGHYYSLDVTYRPIEND